MPADTSHIVNKAWNYAHVFRDDGLSYMAYTEQITFPLFLKMADELTRLPHSRLSAIPAKFYRPYGHARIIECPKSPGRIVASACRARST